MGSTFQLDMPTLIVARIISVLIFALGVTVLTLRRDRRETVLFSWALLTGILAWVTVIAASRSGSHLFMVAHVGLITGTISLQVAATAVLIERPIGRFWLYAPPLATMLVALFPQFDDSLTSLVSSVVLAGQLAAASVFVISPGVRQVRMRTAILMAVGYAITLCSVLGRIVGTAFWPELMIDPLASVPANTVPFLLSYLGTILITLSWLAALKDRAEVALQDLAFRDELTGLANRRHLRERGHLLWTQARRQGAEFSLIVIDVDHFKLVNDRWGHDEGDRVLAGLGAILQQVRSGDKADIAARMGGEEFCLVLLGLDSRRAHDLAENIRLLVANALRLPDSQPVRFSAGIAQSGPEDVSIEMVYRRADDALYQAKASGRDCSVISQPAAALAS